MIGKRTRLSLAQYLDHLSDSFLEIFFEKHGLGEAWKEWDRFTTDRLQALARFLPEVPSRTLQALVEEIVATEADFHDHAVNQWGDGAGAYAARWRDLLSCLALDGYAVSQHKLLATDPSFQGAGHVEDALMAEIGRSGLPTATGILGLLEQSANAFRQVPPNYNACLSNARAALQTLATEIAQARKQKLGGSFQADKWGQVLSYLRTSELLTEAHENLIASVYTFVSPGAHKPVGLSGEEMVRLGRGMAVSVSYFLTKLHNG